MRCDVKKNFAELVAETCAETSRLSATITATRVCRSKRHSLGLFAHPSKQFTVILSQNTSNM